ncbi:MAG TPA: tetratricopeptide repeat protein [Kofleriaceae bacterium]|nr:tetratricopeptide repeat protein [Kofleriaceae bacterium]
MRIRVERDASGRAEVVAYDARELFDQAVAAQRGEEHALALELYRRLVEEFPGSALVSPALYNTGLALEATGDRAGAIARYQELARRFSGTRDALDAQLRAAAVMAELGRFGDALALIDSLLASREVAGADRIELLARRGHMLVETRSYPDAEKALRAAIDLAGRLPRAERSAGTDHHRAMASYYLAEIPRRQAAAQALRLPDEQLRADLEAKARLILLAQERYQATIDLGDLHWATASGFQMASMQEDMWRSLVSAPVPPQLSDEEARVYIDEVRALARGHLERAVEVHAQTVSIADRLGAPTPWSEASRVRIAALSDALAREAAGQGSPTGAPGAGALPGGPSPGGLVPSGTDPDRYVPGRVEL